MGEIKRLTRLNSEDKYINVIDNIRRESTHLRPTGTRRAEEPLTTEAAFFSVPDEVLVVLRVVGGRTFTAIFLICARKPNPSTNISRVNAKTTEILYIY